MGRNRRQPKDDKDAKELERLRRNQANCRKRKLDQIDTFKQKIEELERNLQNKMGLQQAYIQKVNELRKKLIDAKNSGQLALADPHGFEFICKRAQELQRQLNSMRDVMDKKTKTPNRHSYGSGSPSSSQQS